MTSATVVLWLGGFLLFYGTEAFKTGSFPLLFLVFFIPIPIPVLNKTVDILRRGSADMAFVILKLSEDSDPQGRFCIQASQSLDRSPPECGGSIPESAS
jgi:hypothetical protein